MKHSASSFSFFNSSHIVVYSGCLFSMSQVQNMARYYVNDSLEFLEFDS
jgi:hypothetical protein